jgi:hypothetical protein
MSTILPPDRTRKGRKGISDSDTSVEAASGLVNASELARQLGVSKMAVSKWKTKDGLKPSMVTSSGQELYDVETVRAWRSVMKPDMGGLGHGGNRGGGRPRADGTPAATSTPKIAKVTIQTEDGQQTIELTTDELKAFVADPTGEALSLLKARTLKEQMLAAKAAAEATRLRGDYLLKSDVENDLTRTFTTFGRLLDAAPDRMLPKLIHAAQVVFDAEGPHAGLAMIDKARLLTQQYREILRTGIEQTKAALVNASNQSVSAAA